MIVRGLLLLLTVLSFSSSLQAGLWSDMTTLIKGPSKPPAPTIRILIAHDLEGAQLEVKGTYSLYDPFKQEYLSTRFAGKRRYVQALSDGLKWGETFPGLFQLQVQPENRETVTLIDDKPYEGSIYVYDIGGTVSLVNQILVEDYIRSILANYEGGNWHPETLAALAIAERTNAYFQAANPKNVHWAVDAPKVNYKGYLQLRNPNLGQAIEATRYMIMSQTGVYEGVTTPFPLQFGPLSAGNYKDMQMSRISLEEANQMALEGEHAAQILGKAFPGTTIMLMQYATP